jgi:uncharacterized protein (DUF1778 family)
MLFNDLQIYVFLYFINFDKFKTKTEKRKNMHTKSVSRITIDIPQADHKLLKTMAALTGKSMRELVIESIHKQLLEKKRKFNKTTLKAIADAQKGRNLVESEDLGDLFKKLGI